MVLVTGATGFLGSHLLMELLNRDQFLVVRALFRSQESIQNTAQFFAYYSKSAYINRIEWVEADILEIPTLAAAFVGITHVYHCAALVSFDPADEEKLRKTNIEGTANVVNFCLDFKIKKLLFVSSIAALGDVLPHETVITENTEWNPEISHSDYAISKFGAEMEVWRAQQEGLDVLVINPGVILGVVTNKANWNHGSAAIFATIAKSNRFYTKGTTGFVGVSDVVSVMIHLMQSDIINEKYIVVAENIDYKKFVNIIAFNMKQNSASLHAKKWLTELAWRTDWIAANIFGRKRTLSKTLAKSLHSNDFYDNSKIKNQINFQFEFISNCIQEVAVAYFKQHGNF